MPAVRALPAGLAGGDSDEDDEPEVPVLRPVARRERASQSFDPDPYGNHAEQALKLGFALGCDMFFITEAKLLADSGVPRSVLARYPEHLPISLDAAFHQYNDPRFLPNGLNVNLTFDGSNCSCTFPWAAFKKITFFPLAPSTQPEEEPEEEKKVTPRRGHLRLIE